MIVRRGDLFFANLNPVIGSEQGGLRPVLILQNDIGNTYSPTTIVAAVTSKIKRAKLPTHVEIKKDFSQLDRNSVILCEQLRTIDKRRLSEKIGELNEEMMVKVDEALKISVGLTPIE
ncbi:MAG TPA: PemK family transcriptional regulator [Firmicutes bacterium]|nr:PemK family transcriptional regulator [Bacillota bacterium]HBK67174.1 PemK family transcriptional regulator [Bacillota bacterium]HBT17083.1 PemK family transcriptional regulator [Bacillota bacterium]